MSFFFTEISTHEVCLTTNCRICLNPWANTLYILSIRMEDIVRMNKACIKIIFNSGSKVYKNWVEIIWAAHLGMFDTFLGRSARSVVSITQTEPCHHRNLINKDKLDIRKNISKKKVTISGGAKEKSFQIFFMLS